ncbi:transcriptional regulator, TetR family [Lachnospiraceae bacterium KM106-2]|nr:transcriptional regulator, TetR family [Lachnospiraceae bacterium KM106-2]
MRSKEKSMQRIVSSVTELLTQGELDKLTIGDITNHCHMTRQLFYHYFKDKYDVVAWIYKNDFQNLIDQIPDYITYQDLLLEVLHLLKSKQLFYGHALQSKDYNALSTIMITHINLILSCYIRRSVTDVPQDQLNFLIDFYSHGAVRCLTELLTSLISFHEDQLSEWLIDTLPYSIRSQILKCKIKSADLLVSF